MTCHIGFIRHERRFLYSLLALLLVSQVYLMAQMSKGGRATLADLRVTKELMETGCAHYSKKQVHALYQKHGERHPLNGEVRKTEFYQWMLLRAGKACGALDAKTEAK